jgi:hypothetical protein
MATGNWKKSAKLRNRCHVSCVEVAFYLPSACSALGYAVGHIKFEDGEAPQRSSRRCLFGQRLVQWKTCVSIPYSRSDCHLEKYFESNCRASCMVRSILWTNQIMLKEPNLLYT